MSIVKIGSIINGFKIIKVIFESIVGSRSIYKVKCIACGKTYKMRLIDIRKEVCSCCSDRDFNDDNPKANIGIVRGKYTVVGYAYNKDNESKSLRYIVKCARCGALCVMRKSNLFKVDPKSAIKTKCKHKTLLQDIPDDNVVYMKNM